MGFVKGLRVKGDYKMENGIQIISKLSLGLFVSISLVACGGQSGDIVQQQHLMLVKVLMTAMLVQIITPTQLML